MFRVSARSGRNALGWSAASSRLIFRASSYSFRAGVLPLLGGNTGRFSPYGFHDWEFILTETGLLDYDKIFARIAHGIGSALMLLALTWAGYILWKTYNESM